MKYYAYILWSASLGLFYVGSTGDLEDRLSRHNAGYEKSTKNGLPWELAWHTEKPSRAEAYRLELKLKNLKSQKRIQDFISKYS